MPDSAPSELCALCGAAIDGGPFRCPDCDAPHHLDCRACILGCAAVGCPGAATHLEVPELRPPVRSIVAGALVALAGAAYAVVLSPVHAGQGPVGVLVGALALYLLGGWFVRRRFLRTSWSAVKVLEKRPVEGCSVSRDMGSRLSRFEAEQRSLGRWSALVVLGGVVCLSFMVFYQIRCVPLADRHLREATAERGMPLLAAGLVILVPCLLKYFGARGRVVAASVAVRRPDAVFVTWTAPGVEFPEVLRRLPLGRLDRCVVEAGLIGAVLTLVVYGQFSIGLVLLLAGRTHAAWSGPLHFVFAVTPFVLAGGVFAFLLETSGRQVAAAAVLRVRLGGDRRPSGAALEPSGVLAAGSKKCSPTSLAVAGLQSQAMRLVRSSLLCGIFFIPLAALGQAIASWALFGTTGVPGFPEGSAVALAVVVVQASIAASCTVLAMGVVACLDSGVVDLSHVGRGTCVAFAVAPLTLVFILLRTMADADTPFEYWLAFAFWCFLLLVFDLLVVRRAEPPAPEVE